MAPIRLKTWVPRNTKPSWDWKARGSEELDHFTVAFAVKEYVQNIVGQILKDLEVREWSEWNRVDLRNASKNDREHRKRSLIDSYPSLLTGPHGVSLRHRSALPLYILSANIPVPLKTNLVVVIVLWTTGVNINTLSFYNNHLDDHATFETFAVDGYSTSKNTCAVGEKGKGFILATQYMFETIEEQTSPRISFRVGEQIGELGWKKPQSPRGGNPDSLRLFLDDLTTRTISQYLANRYNEACSSPGHHLGPQLHGQKYLLCTAKLFLSDRSIPLYSHTYAVTSLVILVWTALHSPPHVSYVADQVNHGHLHT
ncbi:hypothetical protein C8R44DRAFT_992131 [Mycena epipterygia]|nr:hypothetical protein C8R44DRAFT_992131 [Mycena epipterygia]